MSKCSRFSGLSLLLVSSLVAGCQSGDERRGAAAEEGRSAGGEEGPTADAQVTELPPVVGACQESSDCLGDANCEVCLEEGACADGHVLWVVGSPTLQEGCICTPTEPGDPTCEYEWCCPAGEEWSAEACGCVPCDPVDGGTH